MRNSLLFKFNLLAVLLFNSIILVGQNDCFNLQLSQNNCGISRLINKQGKKEVNYIDKEAALGIFSIKLNKNGQLFSFSSDTLKPQVVQKGKKSVVFNYELLDGIRVVEKTHSAGKAFNWDIELLNESNSDIEILDLFFPIPIGGIDKTVPVSESFNIHKSINGDASFCYWIPYEGIGKILLMTMKEGTSLEYYNCYGKPKAMDYYIHSWTSVDRENDTWRLPSSKAMLLKDEHKSYGFKFQIADNVEHVRELLYQENSIDVRVIPGMTLPTELTAKFSIRSREKINSLEAEYPNETSIKKMGQKKDGYTIYEAKFERLGENMITLNYGEGKVAFLDFFITEPLETLIKKRAKFITNKQQIKDTSKWYDGLYSIWDMKKAECLSPDYKQKLPDYVVGGSDDPSNCKPLYVSEKNVAYPDPNEIAALEYYEKNFVWGGLQRREDEYPYPYGIYGSENWYSNRSGKVAGYNSGGWGKERMWRTFDYTTHFALYYNLYLIARDYPEMVNYLDAEGYLDRAFNTAMAFFEVPYNIYMGEKWSFNGWTDWAYKQGNFHERYIIDIILALEKNGKKRQANTLRNEWEKKVKYFIYDDPWPFGSEMYVDRTAFESSYYIGAYAKENNMKPQEQLWYDKNKQIWYSHTSLSDSATDAYLKNQLNSNFALRSIIEPGYYHLGTAWSRGQQLEYMCQMGGAAILDYAFNYSNEASKHINIGYNSMLSSWALMNTGNKESNYGYWYPGKENDGAVGWAFNTWQNGTMYFKHISTPRGPWRYCGEIDHGLVAGIHNAATYIVEDPLFGIISYGGEITITKNDLKVIPKDGVRRKMYAVLDNQKIGIEMLTDAFEKNEAIMVSNKFNLISFNVENRAKRKHLSSIKLLSLPFGKYQIKLDGNDNGVLIITETSKETILEFPLDNQPVKVELIKNEY